MNESVSDGLLDKPKYESDLIIFIVSDTCIFEYSVEEVDVLLASYKKHYIDNSDLLEFFFYLTDEYIVDSSFEDCISDHKGAIRLEMCKNKFRVGCGDKKKTFSYYRVVSDEKEIVRNEKNKILKNYTEIKEYENKVECVIRYEGKNKMEETWFKNGLKHRDNDLPASIDYCSDGNKKTELWFINGRKHRNGDCPARIDYCVNIGNFKISEEWWVHGKRHREGDLPAYIYYGGDGMREVWMIDDDYYRRPNNLANEIAWYEGGNKKEEIWHEKSFNHCISYLENGEKNSEEWF